MAHRPFVRTLRAQWLGTQLRQLREERGMTLKLVATHLHRDMSALARYERTEWPIRRGDVVALLDLYGFHDAAERLRLLALAEEVWRTDRWDEDYGDVVDASFIQYPWLESRATEIKSYNPMLVPGLLQHRAYAEAIIRGLDEPDLPQATVDRYLEFRMERQEILRGVRPPRINAVLDEAALRRCVGGPEVMRSQLQHLVELAKRPAIDLRVLGSRQAMHAGLYGAYIIFTMPQPYPAVAYVENLAGRLYVEAPKSEKFVRAYASLLRVTRLPGVGELDHSNRGGAVMNETPPTVAWQISTHSDAAGGNCVEAGPVLDGSGRVAVRHSRAPDAAVIVYTRAEWDAFLAGARDGEFDFPAAQPTA